MNLASHWMGYLLAAVALSHALGIDRRLLGRRSLKRAFPAEPEAPRPESVAHVEVDDLFACDKPRRRRTDERDDSAWPDRWM